MRWLYSTRTSSLIPRTLYLDVQRKCQHNFNESKFSQFYKIYIWNAIIFTQVHIKMLKNFINYICKLKYNKLIFKNFYFKLIFVIYL